MKYLRWFSEIGMRDIQLVGGKNASLGEMYRSLALKGIRVPNGFALTSAAYRHFLSQGGTNETVSALLAEHIHGDLDSLRSVGRRIRSTILNATLPQDLEDELLEAYDQLVVHEQPVPGVAVRSSATAEDLPDASFAGQQETFLNVTGKDALLESCKRCFASLFTDRAISYRHDKGFDHTAISLSVGIQRMVRADLACSGVMFTIDTESGFPDVVLINSAYGLGENVVQGTVNPDEFYVFKPTLRAGLRPIIQKTVGSKERKMILLPGLNGGTRNVEVAAERRSALTLTDDEILTLARWGCIIEDHYSERKGARSPMDIEWAKDGISGELFIVQARPETVQSQRQTDSIEIYELKRRDTPLVTGRSVGSKIAAGAARIVMTSKGAGELQQGEILVTDKTDPDWEPAMKRAAGIVTNRGGRTCHAAIVSRELGVPAVVGTNNATDLLKTGQNVTLSCAEGDEGYVYDGRLEFTRKTISLTGLKRPETRVMLNVGDPAQAFQLSFLPNDGVGLAREEFIIGNHIKIHPLALVHYDQLNDEEAKAEIDRLTAHYTDKSRYFVDKLAEGTAVIAAAFFPKDVIVRLSDFKTNEYANLIGGKQFEPAEENPMIGFRGASRYYDPKYREGFELECLAMKRVRDEMGLTNVKLMVPFCRTIDEARKVLAEMEQHGLRRGENGLEVYVMCEIPSNVVLAEEFADVFDGFSIGSNDLTQLTLGIDRDSELIAHIFDERNAAVMELIRQVIHTARRKGRKIGICGQAPSDYPEFAGFLVREGIDSISLNPDAVLRTTKMIVELEERLTRTKPTRAA